MTSGVGSSREVWLQGGSAKYGDCFVELLLDMPDASWVGWKRNLPGM